MFTSGLKLLDAVNAKGYRKTLNDTSFTAFQFTPYNLPLEGGMTANYIKIPHSTYSVSEFFYHSADGKYYHNQFGDKHVDGQTGEQIATENVMILFTQQSLYPGQTVTSYRKIDLVGEGKGYYANGGEMIPIVWKRSSETGAFSYYREDGTELSVKCGKSYISIADQAIANQIVFS